MSSTSQSNPAPQNTDEVAALKKELESMKNYMGEIGPFVQDASLLIAAIAQDPNLKKNTVEAVNQYRSGQPPVQQTQQPQNQTQQYQQPQQQQNQWKFDPVTGQPLQNQPVQQQQTQPQQHQESSLSPTVQGMDVKMREDIVTQIESKYGYSNLPADKKKDLRRQVETKLKAWGQSVMTVPVNDLPKVLEDAYVLTDLNTANAEGRLNSIVEARNNEMGMLPTMGNTQPKEDTTQLSNEQQKWTKRWNLPQDKVAERLKELTETGVATYKPKEDQPKQTTPAPSGQPTPPAQS